VTDFAISDKSTIVGYTEQFAENYCLGKCLRLSLTDSIDLVEKLIAGL